MLSPAANHAINQCYALMGLRRDDPMRYPWNELMTAQDRRLFLMAARLPASWSERLWDQINPEHQRAIEAATKRLRAVVDRVFSVQGGQ